MVSSSKLSDPPSGGPSKADRPPEGGTTMRDNTPRLLRAVKNHQASGMTERSDGVKDARIQACKSYRGFFLII